jgi:hypothetical protein
MFNIVNLNKKIFGVLIQKATTLNLINEILLQKQKLLDVLEIINEQKSHIIDVIQDKQGIKIYKFVKLQKDDDLQKISEQINSIIDYEKEIKKIFVIFNDDMFDEYLKFYKDEDFDKLVSAYKIIKTVKEFNKSPLRESIKIFKKSAKNLISVNRLKNNQYLDYIDNIESFNKTELFKLIGKIEIKAINSDFYKKWKNINWANIFKINNISEYDFYRAVCERVDELENFGVLFQLFDIKKDENNEKYYSKEMIKCMQERFISFFFENGNNKTHINYVEDVANLIYYSEKIKMDVSCIIYKCILTYYLHVKKLRKHT